VNRVPMTADRTGSDRIAPPPDDDVVEVSHI
jgi:hypothetical protein